MSLPFTCAQPVTPGTSLWMPFFVLSSMRSSWLYSAGLGPTKLISPFSTLHNCGNSSRLNLRRSGPMGVRYFFGFSIRCVATGGVSVRMVLNLGILNIVLFIPTLSDQCNTGPFDVNFTNNAMISSGILKTTNKIIATKKSKVRFMPLQIPHLPHFFYCFFPTRHQIISRHETKLFTNAPTVYCHIFCIFIDHGTHNW